MRPSFLDRSQPTPTEILGDALLIGAAIAIAGVGFIRYGTPQLYRYGRDRLLHYMDPMR